jgi:hypothetical protein
MGDSATKSTSTKVDWLCAMRALEVSGIIDGDDPSPEIKDDAQRKMILKHAKLERDRFNEGVNANLVQVNKVFSNQESTLSPSTVDYLQIVHLIWFVLILLDLSFQAKGNKKSQLSPKQIRNGKGGLVRHSFCGATGRLCIFS